MKTFLLHLAKTFKEPSTMAGLSVLWTLFVPELPFEPFANAGAAVLAAASILMREGNGK